MRRIAGWCVAGGLVLFAATSAFSISAATCALIAALAGALALVALRDAAPMDRGIAVAVGIYLLLKFITVLTAVEVRPALREFVEYWPWLALVLLPLARKAMPRPVVLLRVLAVGVAAASIYAIFQHFVGIDYLHHRMLDHSQGRYRAVALFSHHLTWGGYALFAALFFAGQRPQARRDRWLLGGAAVLALLGMLATYSRGPAVGLAAGLAVYVVLRRSGWKLTAWAALVTALALVVTPGLFSRFSTAAAVDLNPHAAESRTGIWLSAWAIGKAHPLTGVGPGNFAAAFERYRIDPVLPPVSHAHDQWLDEWATSGLLGVIGFTIVMATVALALWRRRRQEDGLPLAALAAWCGLATAALFECHFTDAEILLVAVFCAGMGLMAGPPTSETENRE
jgi:O-antigen ligase